MTFELLCGDFWSLEQPFLLSVLPPAMLITWHNISTPGLFCTTLYDRMYIVTVMLLHTYMRVSGICCVVGRGGGANIPTDYTISGALLAYTI